MCREELRALTGEQCQNLGLTSGRRSVDAMLVLSRAMLLVGEKIQIQVQQAPQHSLLGRLRSGPSTQ